MREIELKFKLDNLAELINNLERFDCQISDYIIQNDTIYVFDLNNVESCAGSVWLRVRRINDKVELNYKKQSLKKSESQEIEFGVDDYLKANSFLKALGYKEWVRVNKKRRYSKYDDVNICIDEVERLGNFVEIELLVEESDKKDNYEEKLLKIAKKLGINTKNKVDDHYDTMIANLEE